jgi:hypothetical protein
LARWLNLKNIGNIGKALLLAIIFNITCPPDDKFSNILTIFTTARPPGCFKYEQALTLCYFNYGQALTLCYFNYGQALTLCYFNYGQALTLCYFNYGPEKLKFSQGIKYYPEGMFLICQRAHN